MKLDTLSPIYVRFATAFAMLFTLFSFQAFATHIKSAEITYKRVSASTLTYRFTVSAIRDVSGQVPIGLGVFDFGDGNIIENPREKFESRETYDNGELIVSSFLITSFGNYEFVTFEMVYTYSSAVSRITVSYQEENRNEGILNFANSDNTVFYVESELAADPIFGINNSPELLILPLDEGITGEIFTHNPGAFDSDGDSLSYSLIVPQQGKEIDVSGYSAPNSPVFYDDFARGNSDRNGVPTFEIDSQTGTITWDAPGQPGEYSIAILVEEWRKIEGVRFKIGSVVRDMQITIGDSGMTRPDLLSPVDKCLLPGTLLDETLQASSESGEEVTISVFSNTSDIDNPPSFSDPVFTDGETSRSFLWETNRQHIRTVPWQFIARASERNQENNSISTFQNWKIAIKDEAPSGLQADTSFTATIDLQWDAYTLDGADEIQIWRRENSITDIVDSCFFSPDSYGYELVQTVDATETFFRDDNNGNGLLAGTSHCYRITATHSDVPDVFSYFSEEACDKLGGTRPVITSSTSGLTETSLLIYPNPSADVITINSANVIRQLEVVNIKGSTISVIKPNQSKVTMNLCGIDSGVYIVRAYTDQGMATQRLVKE